MRKHLTWSVMLLGLLVAFPSLARADAQQGCIVAGTAMDLAAKTAYQQGLRDLAVAKRSDFAFLADINRDFQISLSRLRAAKMNWLAEAVPQRIVTDKGATVFTNFDWSEADDVAFMAADARHASLSQKADQWRRMNDNNKAWPAFRSWFRQEVALSDDFMALTKNLTDARAALETHLADCSGQ
jgi:hypothetical protein